MPSLPRHSSLRSRRLPTRSLAVTSVAIILLALCNAAFADTHYYHHVFFDNSLTPDNYFYSSGTQTAPSTLVLLNDRLPVEHDFVHTPPNALRIEWNSKQEGNWVAEVHVKRFRNREHEFEGSTLTFWLFATDAITAADLPLVRIADTDDGFSKPIPLATLVQGVPARKWTRGDIPLSQFVAA